MGLATVLQRDLKKGMRGDDVKQWQRLLLGQGFDPGAVTGVFNAQTRQATIDFQTSHGLDGTGIVDQRTRERVAQGKP